MSQEYVVYIHYLNNEVIYVGSGTNERSSSRVNRNKEHSLDMEKEGFRCEIVFRTPSRVEAYKEEYKIGYYFKSIGQAKYFLHDMRGKNNPMYGVNLNDILSDEEKRKWKEKLSNSLKGKQNGYRTEVTVLAPFEEEEHKKSIKFDTISEAKLYIHKTYGVSFAFVDKTIIDCPYNPGPCSYKKYRHLKGLMVRRESFHGKRNIKSIKIE